MEQQRMLMGQKQLQRRPLMTPAAEFTGILASFKK
jgi:hypothetical protein